MPRGGIVLSMVWGFQGEGGEDAISKISGSICERFILDCTHTYIHIQKQESQETNSKPAKQLMNCFGKGCVSGYMVAGKIET